MGGCVGACADAARSNSVRRGESGVALISTHLDPSCCGSRKRFLGFDGAGEAGGLAAWTRRT